MAWLYFLPFCVGHWRCSTRQRWLFGLNLALGWTGAGWVCLLVWASLLPRKPAPLTPPPLAGGGESFSTSTKAGMPH
nr:superinfection immunity protein [Formicincola oecophyllae]